MFKKIYDKYENAFKQNNMKDVEDIQTDKIIN